MNLPKEAARKDLQELFAPARSYSFMILVVMLYFTSFRPDLLLPGGKILTYIPTLLIFLLLLQWIVVPQKKLSNPQTKYYFMFVLLMVVQLLFARNVGWALMALKSVLLYGISMYLFRVQFIDNYTKLHKYITLFVGLSLFFAVLGVVSKGKVGVYVLRDENDFCLLMNFMLPFAYFLGQEAQDPKMKKFYFALAILFVAGNIASFSRGGFVGLVAVSLYLFYKSRHKVFFVVMAVVIALATVSFAPQKYLDEIQSIDTESYKRDTGATRVESWKAGWEMFKDNPLIGVGAQNFGVWHADYYDQDKNSGKMWGRVAHSLYLTLIPEMGIVGTILFFGMLWVNYTDHRYICNLEKRKNDLLPRAALATEESKKIDDTIRKLYFLSLAFSGAMVAYLVTGIFISVLWYSYFWTLSAFWVVTVNLARKTENILLSSLQTTSL